MSVGGMVRERMTRTCYISACISKLDTDPQAATTPTLRFSRTNEAQLDLDRYQSLEEKDVHKERVLSSQNHLFDSPRVHNHPHTLAFPSKEAVARNSPSCGAYLWGGSTVKREGESVSACVYGDSRRICARLLLGHGTATCKTKRGGNKPGTRVRSE